MVTKQEARDMTNVAVNWQLNSIIENIDKDITKQAKKGFGKLEVQGISEEQLKRIIVIYSSRGYDVYFVYDTLHIVW